MTIYTYDEEKEEGNFRLIDTTCPVCQKNFIPAIYHAYTTAKGKKLVCSYSCMLKSERAFAQQKKAL